MRKVLVSLFVLAGVGTTIGFVACGDTPGAEVTLTNTSKQRKRIDAGQTCEKPLAITGMMAALPFPRGKDFVALSGNGDEEVPDGAIGAVRAEGTAWDLAIRVNGKPVTLPDSRFASHVAVEDFPGTPYQLVAFSHTKLLDRGVFAGRTMFEVDRGAWALELQLVDEAGRVIAKTTVTQVRESVAPYDIDVKLGPNKAAVLVQWDKRGYIDSRTRGTEKSSPTAMQVLQVSFANSRLEVTKGVREAMTVDDIHALASKSFHVTTCDQDPDFCGPIAQGNGDFIDCGTCAGDLVCDSNHCRQASEGACVPTPRAELCPPRSCGKRYDGCTTVVDCGNCTDGLECGGGEEFGMCSDPFALTASDIRGIFGGAVCGCFSDDRANTISVECEPGQKCEDQRCIGTPDPDPDKPDLLSTEFTDGSIPDPK